MTVRIIIPQLATIKDYENRTMHGDMSLISKNHVKSYEFFLIYSLNCKLYS